MLKDDGIIPDNDPDYQKAFSATWYEDEPTAHCGEEGYSLRMIPIPGRDRVKLKINYWRAAAHYGEEEEDEENEDIQESLSVELNIDELEKLYSNIGKILYYY